MTAADVPHLGIARGSLVFCGVMYILLGLGLGPLGGLSMLAGAEGGADAAFGAFFALVMLVVCAGVGVLNLVAAWGLGDTSRRWAWYMGIILGFIYVPSGCLPFGLAIVMPLFSKTARDAYGV